MEDQPEQSGRAGASDYIDIEKSVALIKGAVLDHEATWRSYLDEEPPWLRTAVVLSFPMVVVSAVGAFVLTLVFSGSPTFGGPGFVGMLYGIVMGCAGIVIWAFVIGGLASAFGGSGGFDRGLAAISLVLVPAFAANIVAPLPYIGVLISLASAIYALVLLYRIIPIALNVPQEKRTIHFIVSFIVGAVANIVLAVVLGIGVPTSGGTSMSSIDEPAVPVGYARELKYAEQAIADEFDPPSDGKLTEQQVARALDFMTKTKRLRDGYAAQLEGIGDKEDTSFSDIVTGFKQVVNFGTAEMEVVVSGVGNWAEHEWVKQQLFEARVHRDTNDAVEHNYALYEQFEDELAEVLF